MQSPGLEPHGRSWDIRSWICMKKKLALNLHIVLLRDVHMDSKEHGKQDGNLWPLDNSKKVWQIIPLLLFDNTQMVNRTLLQTKENHDSSSHPTRLLCSEIKITISWQSIIIKSHAFPVTLLVPIIYEHSQAQAPRTHLSIVNVVKYSLWHSGTNLCLYYEHSDIEASHVICLTRAPLVPLVPPCSQGPWGIRIDLGEAEESQPRVLAEANASPRGETGGDEELAPKEREAKVPGGKMGWMSESKDGRNWTASCSCNQNIRRRRPCILIFTASSRWSL